jgi:hypothetical protein
VGDVAEETVGDAIGLVSVGDGSEVGHGSVGEGSAVGLGSVGEGVGVGSVGEGVAVGIGSVGEGSVGGGGLSVGVQATVRGDGFWVVVGSLWATAGPPRADPKTAVAASIARTQARSLTAGVRRAVVTRRRCGRSTDPSSLQSCSTTLSRLPGHPQGHG